MLVCRTYDPYVAVTITLAVSVCRTYDAYLAVTTTLAVSVCIDTDAHGLDSFPDLQLDS